jgi:thioredoxin-dependent adenylylsulfate APS reductase
LGLSWKSENLPAAEVLAWAISTYGKEFGIATSFQKEGMVIVDLAYRAAGPAACRVFTLDTGRLPDETYRMMEVVRERYAISIETVSPEPRELEPMVAIHGPNLFYQSSALREMCCEIRKVRPLGRKLREFKAWATGLRRDQSETRASVRQVEEIDGRIRVSPLVDWSLDQVEDYTRRNELPVHPLYQQGYTSIGCAPCTRAVVPGEGERAGRWWWEEHSAKECGIHFAADGAVRRNA